MFDRLKLRVRRAPEAGDPGHTAPRSVGHSLTTEERARLARMVRAVPLDFAGGCSVAKALPAESQKRASIWCTSTATMIAALSNRTCVSTSPN